MKPVIPIILASVFLFSCGHSNTQNGAETSETLSGSSANYAAKVGVAVKTSTRTCIAIQNATLKPGMSVVIVSPTTPQNYFQAQVTSLSPSPCPITKELNPSVSSYEVQVPPGSIQLSPMIAVVANAPAFTVANNTVQSDLDQNDKRQSFRLCSSNDGVHLTMWSGKPLESKLLWQGYYYEASNPGLGPVCTLHELSGP